jgi:hypothetical protein
MAITQITSTRHQSSLPVQILENNKAAYYIHWVSKLATSANKHGSKASPELKPLQKSSRNDTLGTHHAGKKISKLISFLLFGTKILQLLLFLQKVCI